jgi:LemA protein
MEPGIVILILAGVFILLPSIWLIGNYNAMVRLRNFCDEAWSGIDTELKRRYDLIPNLVETVRGYAAHERQTLERVIEARNRAAADSGSPAAQADDENAMIAALRSMLALVEGYPELKASANFLALQNELVNTEDRIQAARRFYNANVRDLNTRVEVFPSNVIAVLFGFQQKEFFEIENAIERATPEVRL